MSTICDLDRVWDPITAAFTSEVARQLTDLRADDELHAEIATLRETSNAGHSRSMSRRPQHGFVEAVDLILIDQHSLIRILATASGVPTNFTLLAIARGLGRSPWYGKRRILEQNARCPSEFVSSEGLASRQEIKQQQGLVRCNLHATIGPDQISRSHAGGRVDRPPTCQSRHRLVL